MRPPAREAAPGQGDPSPESLPAGSARARALLAVTQAAAAQGLGASVAPAEPWQMSIRVADAHGAALTLFFERARSDGRYYRRTARLGFWYSRGEGSDNPPWSANLLKAVADALLDAAHEALADELPEHGSEARSTGPANPYARLRVLGAADVERFFHVDYEFEGGAEVDVPPTARIGIIYQCNQPCTFCELAEMNTHIPPERIYAALDESRGRGARRVILTGGEPTMCRHLADYVRYAKEHGFTTIEMQTNATLLDDPALAARLREAGLTDAQVSLHGPDSEISDRLTAAPGTHRRTLAGVGNLLDAGVRVLLNHLIFRDNCHLLVDFVEMVEARWGRHRDRLVIQFHSPLHEFSRIELARRHIARYTEYALSLRRAIDRARELGHAVKDLQDPTGIPALCVLGADADYLGPILSQRRKPRFHRWESEWLTRVEACNHCAVADACMGIPKGYLAIHGADEFRPFPKGG